MKASELRIGNWVEKNEITYKGLKKIVFKVEINNFIHCLNYQPIPLTPEILEKAGFEKTDLFNSYFLPYTGFRYYFDDQTFNIDGYDVADFKYLHQLQNLYFALTGEELDITL